MTKITILKAGNRLAVTPRNSEVYGILEPGLQYTEKRLLYGEERSLAGSPVELIDYDCYTYDAQKRLCCPFGFYPRIRKTLLHHGYQVVLKDLRPHPKPQVYEPNWDEVVKFAKLRYGQNKFLVKVAAKQCGRFSCPPGYGKSFLIALLSRAFLKARIHVVAPDADVIRTIYNDLIGMIPNVSLKGAGGNSTSGRVQCYCAASMHHGMGNADFLLADEVDKLAADRYAESLVRYHRSRNFGFSATNDMRLDNKDKRLEGIFGPVIYELSYEECVKHNLIVPIEVRWVPVILDQDPCEGMTGIPKKRWGIWRNTERNIIIAEEARKFDKDEQTLISVRTIDHAVHLKKLLPEFTLVYAEGGLSWKGREMYTKWRLISDDEPIMTNERRDKIRTQFEKGKLKKVIANSVWDQGVNFRRLSALIRADASASPRLDTQIPGRTSRKFPNKPRGIIIDLMDQFNEGFRSKAGQRKRSYKAQGWEQVMPDKPKSKFRQTILFG